MKILFYLKLVSQFEDEEYFGVYNDGKEVYGDDASKTLSQKRPDLALNHADTFSYYVSQRGDSFNQGSN